VVCAAGLEQTPWWRFQGDRIVERALRIMHENPAHPWTMDKLAAESCASRASLARRFHDVGGEPPMKAHPRHSSPWRRHEENPAAFTAAVLGFLA
jgi:AraC-like DNA-binding protein